MRDQAGGDLDLLRALDLLGRQRGLIEDLAREVVILRAERDVALKITARMELVLDRLALFVPVERRAGQETPSS